MVEQSEIELKWLREERQRERQERLEGSADRERETARVGEARHEGWDPFRRA